MPSGATQHLSHFYLYFDGALDSEMQDDLLSLTIESSLHLPDTATLVLNDPNLKWVDHDKVMPGKQLKIQAESGAGPATIFEGELVELEPHYEPEGMKLTIRGFDKMHRLTRGRFVKSFVDVKDSDVMKKIIGDAGLQAKVHETTVIHKHLIQGNQSNFEFLRDRAAALGYFMYAEGNTIHCEPPPTAGVAAELQWHQNLGDFRPRLSTVGMVSEVNVRGWDPKNKEVITATQNRGQGAPKIGVNQTGSEIARSAHNINATYLVNDPLPRDTAAATVLADAVANRLIGHFVEADGTCGGDPKILAGQKVKISRVGTRFSGEYFITSATHIFQQKLGYVTHFSVSGQNPSSLLSSLSDRREYRAAPSITVALVTDNQDPENMNRVKLKYPAFSDQDSSYWARIATPDAGNKRGVQFLPEVNDEVLVAFEQGDVNQPYVIGSLWNGKDEPPQPASDAKDKRMIRSRSGHVIILDDTSGSEKIIIKDKTEKNIIQIDSSSNEMKISMEGETKIIAKGKISLESGQEVSIKGQMGVKIEGLQVDIKGSVGLKMDGGAMAELKGGLVKIN